MEHPGDPGEFIAEHLAVIIIVAVVILVIGFTIGIVLTWLSSRGRFMFLHCVAENKAQVKVPWRKYRKQGNSLHPSFMMSYWPGNNGCGFDPIGTIPDVVNNSLLFMWDKTLDVLPALPEQWPEGSIKGILLRDQVKLNGLFWKKSGKHIEMSLTSKIKQDITLRLADGNEIESVKIIKGSGRIKKISNRKNCYRLSLNANEEVLLKIKR